MEDNKKNKIIGIVLILIILICIVALGLYGFSILKNEDEKEEVSTFQENQTIVSGSGSKANSSEGTLNAITASSKSQEKKYMEDYEIIGNLEIPKTELKTNVLSETTKRSLEIAVSQIYTTNGLNQPGNTVIYGHNYRNTLFFSRNDELSKGDKFYITDTEGNKKTYQITDIFETTATDTSFYVKSAEQTAGKAQATLSTCTDDASSTDRRLIVIGLEV